MPYTWDMKPTIEYLAGFFDGEGCVSIAVSHRSKGRLEYCIRVGASQKSTPVLYVFKEKFGGNVCTNRAGCSNWTLSGFGRVELFLNVIQPYLIVKERAAEIARMFIATGGQHNGMHRIPDDIQTYREEIRKLLREENRR